MVDELLYFSDEKSISGFKVRPDNIFVENNHLIETGIIENMAQSVALHSAYQTVSGNTDAKVGYLGSIAKAEIIRLPETGETLETKVEILMEYAGMTQVYIKVYCRDRLIATSQMKTVLAK